MFNLKSIKIYFLSILKLILLKLKNLYFKSSFYNHRLISNCPSRIFYNPSAHLIFPLISSSNDVYKIENISPSSIWEQNYKKSIEFDNLQSFLWLTKLDRKSSKIFTQAIIKSWINKYYNYNIAAWKMDVMSKRIIAWASNTDLTLQDSDSKYRKDFFLSIIKQSNHLLKNIQNLAYDSNRIIVCAALILSGLIFKETFLNTKSGLKELEKVVTKYFDKSGFVKSRSPEEIYICLKFLILIREWLKEAHESIPEFLNEIIYKCGGSYQFLSNLQKKFPLFNGTTEFDHTSYDVFLKNFKYKFKNETKENGGFIKIKKEKLEFFIDVGNPPPNIFSNNYQAGCLAFEFLSNGQKIICNSGYAKHFPNLSLISCSTAAHSTLYLNDRSSCIFEKNKIIRKIYGNSLVRQHRILSKNLEENEKYYLISASHNGFEKKSGYLHKRSVKIYKKQNKIIGEDELKKTKSYPSLVNYSIRFYVYPGTKIAKTQKGNSVVISLPNREGWQLKSEKNNFQIEKGIFFGNKNKIINNECIFISGKTTEKKILIEWTIERIT